MTKIVEMVNHFLELLNRRICFERRENIAFQTFYAEQGEQEWNIKSYFEVSQLNQQALERLFEEGKADVQHVELQGNLLNGMMALIPFRIPSRWIEHMEQFVMDVMVFTGFTQVSMLEYIDRLFRYNIRHQKVIPTRIFEQKLSLVFESDTVLSDLQALVLRDLIACSLCPFGIRSHALKALIKHRKDTNHLLEYNGKKIAIKGLSISQIGFDQELLDALDLSGAFLIQCGMVDLSFNPSQNLSFTRMTACDLSRSSFEGLPLITTVFESCLLLGAVFDRATLSDHFRGVSLLGCQLKGATFLGSVVLSTHLRIGRPLPLANLHHNAIATAILPRCNLFFSMSRTNLKIFDYVSGSSCHVDLRGIGCDLCTNGHLALLAIYSPEEMSDYCILMEGEKKVGCFPLGKIQGNAVFSISRHPTFTSAFLILRGGKLSSFTMENRVIPMQYPYTFKRIMKNGEYALTEDDRWLNVQTGHFVQQVEEKHSTLPPYRFDATFRAILNEWGEVVLYLPIHAQYLTDDFALEYNGTNLLTLRLPEGWKTLRNAHLNPATFDEKIPFGPETTPITFALSRMHIF